MTFAYIGDPDVPAMAMQSRVGQACEILHAIPDSTDPHPTNDMYRIAFSDGAEHNVYPEELDPIPAPGTGREETTE